MSQDQTAYLKLGGIIERVALAIETTMFAPHELPVAPDLHDRYLVTARAAVEAMREPTTAMVAAAERNNHPRDIETWRTMIGEALA